MRHNKLTVGLLLVSLLVSSQNPPHQLPANAASYQANVLTQHNNSARTGLDPDESTLTVANVNPTQFGKLFSRAVDGQIYAQPLYVSHLAISGQGIHNVVFVATAHNSVYAFDADDPSASRPLWMVNLGPSIPVPDPCFGDQYGTYADIHPEVGITGTPVIDLASNTLYLVAASKEGLDSVGHCNPAIYMHRLHALDLSTGREKFGGPVRIQATARGSGPDSRAGIITFHNLQQLQRPGLLLSRDHLYIGFGSYAVTDPYHGWLLAYDAHTLRQSAVFLDTPDPMNGSYYGGGIWQSGQGPAADDQGNIYIITGNGYFNADRGGVNYGDSIVKLSPSLTVLDWFSPHDQSFMATYDVDFGTSGPTLVPGTTDVLVGDKQGTLFVLDRNHLGHFQARSDSQIVQSLAVAPHLIQGAPVCWAGTARTRCFLWPTDDLLKGFNLANSRFTISLDRASYAVPAASSSAIQGVGFPGGIISISSNGNTAGTAILWVTISLGGSANHQTVPGALYAFDAQHLHKPLWDSQMNPTRDALASFAKFTPPTIANGKLYLATFSDALEVYGLLPN